MLSLLAIRIPIDPVIFKLGGVEVTWHGLLAAVGVIVGVAVAAYFARRAGYSEDHIYNTALALVVGGIVGARGLYVLENLDQFRDDPGQIFALNAGGISIYGALIGGTVGAWLYTLLARVPGKWRIADVAALGAIVGMAIGRVGDIINGEHFAEPTSLPWGVRYTHPDSPSFIRYGPDHVQHPAVAYEMLADLAIFGVLLYMWRRGTRPGLIFLTWAFLYSAMRLGISFLRLDDIVWAGLRTAQIIAIAVMVCVVATLFYLWNSEEWAGEARAERRRRLRLERRRLARQGRGPEP
ncbi:Prolipoprotein diacylglyceryl transferase [bacterium HR24]|jgi:phosphatidylglycerol:prolipoprotein diacylglycerol transferase|nr:Prolipoprotein diacylglyceryl transferase [bacterium HR24]